MDHRNANLNLTAKDIAAAFAESQWSRKFPPLLTVDQAAELLQVPKATIYDWRSRGLLKGCCRRVGKHLRFFRDHLVRKAMNEGI
ncbi:MAG: helix-turn-helix domain-containing protein [Planctomycetaceae bacterium]|nr:helix-turn-helix domain-containing protein [Planctomycetaceae bacterium]